MEKPEEYFVTRYELECKLREIDKRFVTAIKEAGVDATEKNGAITTMVDKESVIFNKEIDAISSRITVINDRIANIETYFKIIIGAITIIIPVAMFIINKWL